MDTVPNDITNLLDEFLSASDVVLLNNENIQPKEFKESIETKDWKWILVHVSHHNQKTMGDPKLLKQYAKFGDQLLLDTLLRKFSTKIQDRMRSNCLGSFAKYGYYHLLDYYIEKLGGIKNKQVRKKFDQISIGLAISGNLDLIKSGKYVHPKKLLVNGSVSYVVGKYGRYEIRDYISEHGNLIAERYYQGIIESGLPVEANQFEYDLKHHNLQQTVFNIIQHPGYLELYQLIKPTIDHYYRFYINVFVGNRNFGMLKFIADISDSFVLIILEEAIVNDDFNIFKLYFKIQYLNELLIQCAKVGQYSAIAEYLFDIASRSSYLNILPEQLPIIKRFLIKNDKLFLFKLHINFPDKIQIDDILEAYNYGQHSYKILRYLLSKMKDDEIQSLQLEYQTLINVLLLTDKINLFIVKFDSSRHSIHDVVLYASKQHSAKCLQWLFDNYHIEVLDNKDDTRPVRDVNVAKVLVEQIKKGLYIVNLEEWIQQAKFYGHLIVAEMLKK